MANKKAQHLALEQGCWAFTTYWSELGSYPKQKLTIFNDLLEFLSKHFLYGLTARR